MPEKGNTQTSYSKVYNVEDLFQLVWKNNQSLKTSRADVGIANQRIEVAKAQRLPQVQASLTGGYLGDAQIIENDFSNSTRVPMPHFSNSFAVQASEVIFNGNAINNTIASASLQEQLTRLSLEENELDTKLLVAGNYFDLFKLYNQRDVYRKNIDLARLRLNQLRKFYDKGMVTRNEIIRSELQLADLKLAVETINKNIKIINKELTTATGLDEDMQILPDTTILANKPEVTGQEFYQQKAQNSPSLKKAEVNMKLAEKNLAIAKAGQLPVLSAYAANNLQRPITSSDPALDEYSNGWEAGLRLTYNISSLYSGRRNVKLSQLERERAREETILASQEKSVRINEAYVEYQKAVIQSATLEENMRLADENYRIIEKKYLNQLALNIDMLDASNAKLEAELDHTNAEINVLYTYYRLQRETGQL